MQSDFTASEIVKQYISSCLNCCFSLPTGEKKGEAKLTLLLETLYDQGRDDEAKLAVRDTEARARLYQELRIPRTLL